MMARSETFRIKLIIWSLFLQSVVALQKLPANNSLKLLKRSPPIVGRNSYEQYTLGHVEDGAQIIYTYQYSQTFDEKQQEISLDFQYPNLIDRNEADVNDNKSTIITQIQLYVTAENGGDTQAYVTEGGIGERYISLQINATNTKFLSYILIVYGKAA